ncbi:thiolase C-terminal domain-containing protein, partial [Vineibacter terrae]
QLAGRADGRQVKDAAVGFVHGDGGVMSSHVSMVLERV